jgi:sigma-B regulation protein RsbU (phosphoserine phosphatase)
LPKKKRPKWKGSDIAIGWRPAREISGDLFDFFEPTEDTTRHCVWDVQRQRRSGQALYGSLVSGSAARSLGATQYPSVCAMAAVDMRVLLERKVRTPQYVTLTAHLLEYQGKRVDAVRMPGCYYHQ